MINPDKALEIILSSVNLLPTEKVSILDSLHRVIAEDIISPYNIPFSDNSAMDGFAIKSEDTKKASSNSPAKLKIVGVIPAGKLYEKKLNRGEAAKIMTGATIPDGADCVARKEICREENGYVYIHEEVEKGKDIRRAGEDIKEGEKVVKRGEVITSATIGVLASLGKSFVNVYRKPTVAVVISGDEILDIDEPLIKGKVKNSNSYTLISLLKEFGATPIYSGIVKDTKDSIKQTISSYLNADIILTTGGVSVGDYDFMKDVIEELGFEIKFWRIKFKPGKPLLFAVKGKTLYFGIPGNPVSTMVIFYNFVLPALLKMQGYKKIFLPKKEAILATPIKRKDSRKECIRGILYEENGKLYVKSTGEQGSGILTSMKKANCFIMVDGEVKSLEKGEKVDVVIFDRFFFFSS